MRASDSDRERIAEFLRRATAEGRLLAEELEERLAAALRARTYGELDALVADLPTGAPARQGRLPSLGLPRPALALALAIAVPVLLAIVAIALFVVTGFLLAWLPWLLICWWTLGGAARGRRYCVYRRGGDPDYRRLRGRLGQPVGCGIYSRRGPRARSW